MGSMMSTRLSSLALACLSIFATSVAAKVTVFQDVLSNGTVTAETVAGLGSLDGVKLSSVSNATSYEW